jgi:CRISPR-associated protein Cmr1
MVMAIDVIEAHYRVVTPMLCGGAEPEKAELRLPSFKGVLRWWWRALAWPRFDCDLKQIKQQEETFFGSPGAASRVVMRFTAPAEWKPLEKSKVLSYANGKVVGEGARYFGYGVMEAFASKQRRTEAGQLSRGCLLAPFDFSIELRCYRVGAEARNLLTDALVALGLLGGMGAKSRKGYGSLVLTELKRNGSSTFAQPKTLAELKQAVEGLYKPRGSGDLAALPPYTAFSARARTVLLPADDKLEPMALLDRVGREMVRYRSWGHNGNVFGRPSEKNFRADHDLMKQPAGQRASHPERIAFGLPHNYGKPAEKQVGPGDSGLDRRASPLLIHIHECSARPVAVLSFLPAQFLPPSARRISVGGKKVGLAGDDVLWKPIEEFLDRLVGHGRTRRVEPFGEALEVSS